MIVVNDCRVSNDNVNIYVNVETNIGYSITSAKLWSDETFKVFSKAKSISLENTSNKEILTITAASMGLKKFDGLYFIEFETSEPGANNSPRSITAVVSNLISHYRCGMDLILKSSLDITNLFNTENGNVNKAMAVHLLIDAINEAIKLNRFVDAINLLSSLKKICNTCYECNSIPVGPDCVTCD
jgi:hypothetical protein